MLLSQFARWGILAIGHNMSKVTRTLHGQNLSTHLFSLHHCVHTLYLWLAEATVVAGFMGALWLGALPAENTQPGLSQTPPLWACKGNLLIGLSLPPCLCLIPWVSCDFLASFFFPQHPMPASAAAAACLSWGSIGWLLHHERNRHSLSICNSNSVW